MLTYLHHSDPTVPLYRRKEWTFLRGAIATVDRPLLGWAGRFFLHNVSHDHVRTPPRLPSRSMLTYKQVAHHLFSTIPFCKCFPVHSRLGLVTSSPDNQPFVTEAIKKVLKDDYNYDSTVLPSICFADFKPKSLARIHFARCTEPFRSVAS